MSRTARVVKHATLSLTFSVFSEQAEFVAIDSIGRRKFSGMIDIFSRSMVIRWQRLSLNQALFCVAEEGNFDFEFPQRKTTTKRRDFLALAALSAL